MSEENVEIVRRCYECVNRRDRDGLWADVDPDFVLKTQLQGSCEGPEEAVEFIQEGYAGFATWSLELDEVIASGEQVLVLVTSRAQPRGATAEIVIKIGHVWTFQDGKILLLETFPRREDALAAGLSE